MKFYIVQTISIVSVFLLFCLSASSQEIDSKQTQANGEGLTLTTEPINDKQIQDYFHKKAEELYHANDCTPFSELNEQISIEHCKIDVDKLQNNQGAVSYEAKKKGTLILGKLGKCAVCPKIHLFTASAFVISEDGLCVTNNHVFSPSPKDKNSYMAVFVMDSEGNVFPVEEVLAANKEDDIALFRVKTNGKKLTPLALGAAIETGAEVSIVSHPDRQYYTYTKGYVTRHFVRHSAPRFSITAEFAVGSSGAAVFDSEGKVAGIVSSTNSIYYNNREGLQMVVKVVIPVKGVKKLFIES